MTDLQRSAGVALTRVLAARLVAGAQKDVRYELVAAGLQEHGLAAVVAHDRHQHLEQRAVSG